MAITILRRALDAFARLNTVSAAQIVRDDDAIDEQFRAVIQKLVTSTMDDPRVVAIALDHLFIAKAVERIGDHATNIAEIIIYVVKGKDVRHVSREQLEHEAFSE
ncbi:Phosphate-specific transport system accessory protein PhoU [Paraburkholderia rhynchosiae]|uniref:Phosphate-specific transport system accessory protein PhoU n=1 Tax=Paraburkholderia rhynchosiae TaxID=487049 RepID=A0A6J5CVL2_9BURK|nr:Phosphate-specific transport system accessory protein PhoU [Paraburkholderia rhynchosiae]